MQVRQQMKSRKAKIRHDIWQPAVVIPIVFFVVFMAIHANAARCMGEMKHKMDMLSVGMDIWERRNNAFRKQYNFGVNCIFFKRMYCSSGGITITGGVYADAVKEYKRVDIYRAGVDESGAYGKPKKIGSADTKKCGTLPSAFKIIRPPGENFKERYTFTYQDSMAEPGKQYVYRLYADGRRLDGKPSPQISSWVEKAFTGSPHGKYICSIVQNTKKKLIVKLAGESEGTGLLKCRIGSAWSAAHLVYKNKSYEAENARNLQVIKYSYDGKKWHDGSEKEDYPAMFTIRGRESVYLWFADTPHRDAYNRWKDIPEDIDFSGYRYAQMMLMYIFYNSTMEFQDELRFNFTSGKAMTGTFTRWNIHRLETEWEDKVFQFLCDGDAQFLEDYESYD